MEATDTYNTWYISTKPLGVTSQNTVFRNIFVFVVYKGKSEGYSEKENFEMFARHKALLGYNKPRAIYNMYLELRNMKG
jgi:hypothetical protein